MRGIPKSWLRSEKTMSASFRTGVRFPSPPPKQYRTNTCRFCREGFALMCNRKAPSWENSFGGAFAICRFAPSISNAPSAAYVICQPVANGRLFSQQRPQHRRESIHTPSYWTIASRNGKTARFSKIAPNAKKLLSNGRQLRVSKKPHCNAAVGLQA